MNRFLGPPFFRVWAVLIWLTNYGDICFPRKWVPNISQKNWEKTSGLTQSKHVHWDQPKGWANHRSWKFWTKEVSVKGRWAPNISMNGVGKNHPLSVLYMNWSRREEGELLAGMQHKIATYTTQHNATQHTTKAKHDIFRLDKFLFEQSCFVALNYEKTLAAYKRLQVPDFGRNSFEGLPSKHFLFGLFFWFLFVSLFLCCLVVCNLSI